MEPESSSQFSQNPASGLYPESHGFIQVSTKAIFLRPILISFHLRLYRQNCLFCLGFPTETFECIFLSPILATCSTLIIFFHFILQVILVKSTTAELYFVLFPCSILYHAGLLRQLITETGLGLHKFMWDL